MIPKIIHYCWLSDDPIPADMSRYMDSWKSKLKDYQFIKWDLKRFPKESSIWVSEAFDSKKYAFAADYIRLYAVYHYGGIYLDMDVEVLRAFDKLLDQPYMIAVEDEERTKIEAGCFGAEAGNEFIEKCLAYYHNRHFILKDGLFDTLVLSKIMMKILKENHFNINIYSWQYFTAKSWFTGKECPTDETYAVHHFKGSWRSEEEQYYLAKRASLCRFLPYGIAHKIARIDSTLTFNNFRTAVPILLKRIRNKTQ